MEDSGGGLMARYRPRQADADALRHPVRRLHQADEYHLLRAPLAEMRPYRGLVLRQVLQPGLDDSSPPSAIDRAALRAW
jgi:hypothetical protein